MMVGMGSLVVYAYVLAISRQQHMEASAKNNTNNNNQTAEEENEEKHFEHNTNKIVLWIVRDA